MKKGLQKWRPFFLTNTLTLKVITKNALINRVDENYL